MVDVTGTPVTGLSSPNILLFEQKPNATSFTPIGRPMIEVGLGVYDFTMNASDTDTFGNLLLVTSGQSAINDYTTYEVISGTGTSSINVVTITESTLDVTGIPLGRVVTPANVPISSAKVQAYANADVSHITPLFEEAIVDGDGGYSMQVIGGATYRVLFIASGFDPNERKVTV